MLTGEERRCIQHKLRKWHLRKDINSERLRLKEQKQVRREVISEGIAAFIHSFWLRHYKIQTQPPQLHHQLIIAKQTTKVIL